MPATSRAAPFRADQAGSLLRPAHLIEARGQFRKRLIDAAQLKIIEDDAIREVVALQEAAGLQSISDGEFRRQSYIVDFFRKALGSGGLRAEAGDFFHRNEQGETIPIEKLVIHKPLKWTGPIFAEHLAFLKSITTRTPKMTVPSPIVLVVNPSLSIQTVADLVAYAKKQPGRLQYASAGVGSVTHLAGELFKYTAKIDMLHVPFKGAGAATLDVMAGHTNLLFGGLLATVPQVRSGKLRALGVGSLKRNPILPDVPSIAEAGVPGYETVNWFGLLAPTGTPAVIVERLHREVSVAQSQPEVQKQFDADGASVLRMTPAAFGAYMVADMNKWERVVKEGGIKAQ